MTAEPGNALVPVWRHRAADRRRDFPRAGLGHRGYAVQPVEEFADRVLADLARAEEEIGDLRREIDRLHRYIRRQWAAVAAAESAAEHAAEAAMAGGTPGRETPMHGRRPASPAAQARAVLSQAQELAERRLAQAAERLAGAEREVTARLDSADRLAAQHLAAADAVAAGRIERAERVAARRLAQADEMAERLLAQAGRGAGGGPTTPPAEPAQSRPAAFSAR